MRQRHEERITIKEYEYEYISNMNINEYMCMHKRIYKSIIYIYNGKTYLDACDALVNDKVLHSRLGLVETDCLLVGELVPL